MDLDGLDNVIFDIGNVLLSFRPKDYLSKRFSSELIKELYREVFLSPEWQELDRGTREIEEVIQIVSRRAPNIKEPVEALLGNFTDMFIPIEPSVRALELLEKRGLGLYMLSNFHREAFRQVRERFDFFNLFQGGVISSHHQQLKPEEAIYRTLLDSYGLVAKRSLFIDDTWENLEAAEKLGFKTLHFKEGTDLPKLLKLLD